MANPAELLRALQERVDAFFAKTTARHGAQMQCHTGCADCCMAGLTVTAVEADAISAYVAAHQVTRPAAPAVTNATPASLTPPALRCVALGPDDRCVIYPARPLVCRSHGMPIVLRERGLPVVTSCHRNFVGVQVPPADQLDQATLSAALLSINQLVDPTASRIPLTDLL